MNLIILLFSFLLKPITLDSIVIVKSERKLICFHKGKELTSYKVALGKNPIGKKQIKGDNKTPEGLYYIKSKKPYSKFYKALEISYPNKQDIINAKGKNPGSLIEIHGLGKGNLIGKIPLLGNLHYLSDWTQGCIAITNEEIDRLYPQVKVGTKVIIKP